MSNTTMLIRGMPSGLKQWLADEAARNDRSMSEEAICMVEAKRALRESAPRRARNPQARGQILHDLPGLPVLDAALYDATGMLR